MSWPTTADGQYYLFEGQVLMPVDPETGMAMVMLRPQGGIGVSIPAIEKGDPGQHAEIDETINFTALEPGDPTEDSASWTEVVPPSTSTPGKWKLNLALHKGEKGDNGDATWDPEDLEEYPEAGYIPAVNGDADGFELVPQKVGDEYWPASITNSGTNDANTTLCTIAVPSQPFDWRPQVNAQTTVTEVSSDVSVDLIARLNGESAGNIVGRCFGTGGTERLTITSAPPAGSADGFNKVLAGNSATIYVRVEKQTGSGTYTTSSSTTVASVRVCPVP